jgi:hypothetical protein
LKGTNRHTHRWLCIKWTSEENGNNGNNNETKKLMKRKKRE